MAKSKKPSKSQPGRDGQPLELVVARGHERTGRSDQVIRNVREHPIDMWLHSNPPIIEAYQHQAGEWFMRDWQGARIGAEKTSFNIVRVDNSSNGGIEDGQADAMERVSEALNALGPVDQHIVHRVLIMRYNLDQLGAHMRALGRRWPRKRYGGTRVSEALHELAEHYGLTTSKSRRPDTFDGLRKGGT